MGECMLVNNCFMFINVYNCTLATLHLKPTEIVCQNVFNLLNPV